MDEELEDFLIIIILAVCDGAQGGSVIQPFCSSTGTVLYYSLILGRGCFLGVNGSRYIDGRE